MDGILDGLVSAKQWKCKKGHVLGLVVRTKEQAKVESMTVKYHTSKLIIFRNAVDLFVNANEAVDAAGQLQGRMLLGFSWKCSVPGCGCIREWNPDDEALDWLKKRFEGSRVK